ncbi:ATP-dependent RNA helicase SrmB [Yersinia pseudotuberculosis]|nr:ATP-dependent RNA helicase SrmB [Yersinia pseudotuberculosis]SUP87792.1 ATP-dependent RNA helicase SrmB [Yersinia pseudotuberculosis]
MTVTNFSELDLDERLIDALRDKGYERPTAIQASAIPPAMDGRDVLGSAPTGTGKTAAFLLPALQHLLDFPRKKSGPPRILTPTRELAMQVADQARELAKYTQLDIATITGGVAYMNHAEVFSENQDVVVATTGRLLQYIKEENFDCRAVETLILDEADRMLDMGFAQDIETISAETRWRKQTLTLLFSATLEGEAIREFAERILNEPVELEADPSRRERKKIQQWYYRADDIKHKTALLCHLLKQPDVSKSIIFVRTRERVHELVSWLREAGINAWFLEGEMVQAKRTEAVIRLGDGRVNVLVATDIASRGLDIDDISHVFNFDMPRTADVYLHRIGRTGRAGRKGVAISLVEAHDHILLGKIGRYLNEPLKPRVIDELRPTSKAPSEKATGKPSKKVLAKRKEQKEASKEKVKVKVRHRDAKNVGKRRTPKAKPDTKSAG